MDLQAKVETGRQTELMYILQQSRYCKRKKKDEGNLFCR